MHEVHSPVRLVSACEVTNLVVVADAQPGLLSSIEGPGKLN